MPAAGTSYTRADARSRIQRGLGFRSDLSDEINDAILEAQDELEGRATLPWFLIEEDATMATVADTATIALPTDFIRETEDPFRFTDSDGEARVIEKREFEAAQRAYPGATTESDYPFVYALRLNTFHFFPTPDAAYTITYSYYKKATQLTSDINNVWLANVPNLIVGRAGLILARDLRDPDAVGIFTRMADKWQDWLAREIANREVANFPQQLGANN